MTRGSGQVIGWRPAGSRDAERDRRADRRDPAAARIQIAA